MSKLRILYINHVSQMSGAEKSLLGLLQTLEQREYHIIVTCPAKGILSVELHKLGISTQFINFVRFKRSGNILIRIVEILHYLRTFLKLVYVAKKYRIQLIQSNSTNAQIYGMVLARMLRIPSIWHVRDLVPLGKLGRILYSLSARIIVSSEAVRKHVLNYGNNKYIDSRNVKIKKQENKKVMKIYNGIDYDEWTMKNQKAEVRNQNVERIDNLYNEYKIGLDEKVVAMIGQLVSWKRHKDFIESASLVVKEVKNVKFLIIGDDLFDDHPEYKKELQKLCACLSIQDKIIFTGYRCDILQIMAAIDILVLPSWNEPFGRVIIEAMAMEKPVIATNTGGPPEIIEDGVTGMLVPPRDPQKLAEVIINLLKNPELRMKMGKMGRKRVEKYFDIRKIAKEIEAVYEELLMSKR